MSIVITESDRASTGRHRAPGRNWLGLLGSEPGRHRRALARQARRQALLLEAELELYAQRGTVVLLPRVAPVAG